MWLVFQCLVEERGGVTERGKLDEAVSGLKFFCLKQKTAYEI